MPTPPPPSVPVIEGAALRAVLRVRDRVQLVHGPDGRAFREAHIPGSLLFTDVEQATRVLRTDDEVVVYGRDSRCARSPVLVARLLASGYPRARWYAGGLADWVAAGGLVEGTRQPR